MEKHLGSGIGSIGELVLVHGDAHGVVVLVEQCQPVIHIRTFLVGNALNAVIVNAPVCVPRDLHGVALHTQEIPQAQENIQVDALFRHIIDGNAAAVCTAVPCALSRGGSVRRQGSPIRQEETAVIDYDAKLFASPELSIPAGCRIFVRQDGVLREFVSCGEAMVYPTHQEIPVSREERA